jgi:hypothetical protein
MPKGNKEEEFHTETTERTEGWFGWIRAGASREEFDTEYTRSAKRRTRIRPLRKRLPVTYSGSTV